MPRNLTRRVLRKAERCELVRGAPAWLSLCVALGCASDSASDAESDSTSAAAFTTTASTVVATLGTGSTLEGATTGAGSTSSSSEPSPTAGASSDASAATTGGLTDEASGSTGTPPGDSSESESDANPVDLEVVVQGPGQVISSPVGIYCPDLQCESSFPMSENVELAAVPADGALFVRWEGHCEDPQADVCVLEMSEPRAATAIFEVASELVVEVEGPGRVTGPGAIDCPGPVCRAIVPASENVEVVAAAEPTGVFVRWEDDCAGATRQVCTLEMDEPRHVIAVFSEAYRGGGSGSGTTVCTFEDASCTWMDGWEFSATAYVHEGVGGLSISGDWTDPPGEPSDPELQECGGGSGRESIGMELSISGEEVAGSASSFTGAAWEVSGTLIDGTMALEVVAMNVLGQCRNAISSSSVLSGTLSLSLQDDGS